MDNTENIRRQMVDDINSNPIETDGPVYSTDEMTKEFKVIGFMAPLVVVERRSDGVKGTLMFKHSPRVYFDWKEDK